MILTVTPNTALDKVLFVDDFHFGATVRARDVADGMGGKGAVVSWVLGQLRTPSLATGLAAGETGRRMVALLESAGVTTDFLWVRGETRTNYVLARTADGVQGTVTVAGLTITGQDADRLARHSMSLMPGASALVCGGSLPNGFPADWYVSLITEAKRLGILSILDTSDQFLAPNLVALPDIAKPNAAEASTLLGRPITSVEEALRALDELHARGIRTPIITLGELGAVASTEDGRFFLPPLPVRVVNTAGAGDGFNAGLLQWRIGGASWADSLRRAVAVATAVLLTPGTGACRPSDVERLFAQVRIERVEF